MGRPAARGSTAAAAAAAAVGLAVAAATATAVAGAAARDGRAAPDVLDVRLLALTPGCAAACLDETVTALAAAGCVDVTPFPTLAMVRARCPPPADGQVGVQASLADLPNVVEVVDDFVVEASVPMRGGSDLDRVATKQGAWGWGDRAVCAGLCLVDWGWCCRLRVVVLVSRCLVSSAWAPC